MEGDRLAHFTRSKPKKDPCLSLFDTHIQVYITSSQMEVKEVSGDIPKGPSAKMITAGCDRAYASKYTAYHIIMRWKCRQFLISSTSVFSYLHWHVIDFGLRPAWLYHALGFSVECISN